jgi:hypothetical protein
MIALFIFHHLGWKLLVGTVVGLGLKSLVNHDSLSYLLMLLSFFFYTFRGKASLLGILETLYWSVLVILEILHWLVRVELADLDTLLYLMKMKKIINSLLKIGYASFIINNKALLVFYIILKS